MKQPAWDVMFDSDPGDFVVRGHVDREAFVAAVEGFLVVAYGSLQVTGAIGTMGDVVHDWMRFVPSSDPDDGGGAYWPARAGQRGAFPVTYGTVEARPETVEA